MQRISVLIPLKGDVTISVDGVQGSSCKDLTAALEAALGGSSTEELKSEYYEKPIEQTINQ